MIAMTGWWAESSDAKGAFPCGMFEKGRQMLMTMPQGFEKFYPMNVVLPLLKTACGTKQAVRAFWNESLKASCDMKHTRNKADPCSCFAWTTLGIIIWLSWVDNLICRNKEGVEKAKKQMMDRFDCDKVRELKEHVGCKIDRDLKEGSVKLTQLALLQSCGDEFDSPKGETPNAPAISGTASHKGRTEDAVNEKGLFTCRSGVGKLPHMMKWTPPEILKAVRELSRFVSGATQEHMKAMCRTLNCCVGTPNRGLSLKPTMKWDGNPDFEFVVRGRSDSDFAKDPERQQSVSGHSTFLCGAPVTVKSRMQGCVTPDVTSVELVSGTQCAQDVSFIMRIIESMGLKVKKPMTLEIDEFGRAKIRERCSCMLRV
jgi:hypothetical protein